MSIFTSIKLPRVKRNRFNLSHRVCMSADWGKLYPFLLIECVPNDKFKINAQVMARLAPMLAPIYGRINVRTDFFFVPIRLLWSEWENFITGGRLGESNPVMPYFPVDGRLTEIASLQGVGSLWDYFGLTPYDFSLGNLNVRTGRIISLPFRAYRKIWNDYYRDENLQAEKDLSFDVSGPETDFSLLELETRAWRKDYFTSALPFVQRGFSSVVNIEGTPKMFKDDVSVPVIPDLDYGGMQFVLDNGNPFHYGGSDTIDGATFLCVADDQGRIFAPKSDVETGYEVAHVPQYTGLTPGRLYLYNVKGSFPSHDSTTGTGNKLSIPVSSLMGRPGTGPYIIEGTSLNDALGVSSGQFISINELRRSNAVQKWLERDARGGNRYTESILSHFRARVPDYRLDRAEYLGGATTPVSISEINQTSATTTVDDEVSPLADMAGHGLSFGLNSTRGYRCDEHGYIIGLISIVPEASYSQGIMPMWTRHDRFDFYWPEFAHLGEQPIYQSELFAYGEGADKVFGYTPRYADYKYLPSRVAGQFRNSLEHWTLNRKFAAAPTLSEDFIKIDGESNDLNRIFAVETNSDGSPLDHFLLYINNIVQARRPMPRFGTPRL